MRIGQRAARSSPPAVLDAQYVDNAATHCGGHLWIQLDESFSGHVVLQRIWGTGPASIEHAWNRVLTADNGSVFIAAYCESRTVDRSPFSVGFRVQSVGTDGRLSTPSEPIYVSSAAGARASDTTRSDHVVLILMCVGLLGLWRLYRREQCALFRVRIAGAAALASLLFLSATPSLSWLVADGPDGPALCQLGDEVACATYGPQRGDDPTAPELNERSFELMRWQSSSGSLRAGLLLCLIALLPALIWLVVDPRIRAAQVAVVVGASAALYTFLAVALYRFSIPTWMEVQASWAFDIALIATTNILAAAVAIVRGTTAPDDCDRRRVPQARTETGRRGRRIYWL